MSDDILFDNTSTNQQSPNVRDEIEVTEEMLEAGAAELCLFDYRNDNPIVIAELIFRAMMSLYRKG